MVIKKCVPQQNRDLINFVNGPANKHNRRLLSGALLLLLLLLSPNEFFFLHIIVQTTSIQTCFHGYSSSFSSCFSSSFLFFFFFFFSAGHSLWFKEFFKLYLPKKSNHLLKTNKMKNCGVVSFELVQSQADNNQDGTVDGWYIKEETISEDYLKITPKSNKSSMKKKKIMFGFILFILGPLIAYGVQYELFSSMGMTVMCTTGVSVREKLISFTPSTCTISMY